MSDETTSGGFNPVADDANGQGPAPEPQAAALVTPPRPLTPQEIGRVAELRAIGRFNQLDEGQAKELADLAAREHLVPPPVSREPLKPEEAQMHLLTILDQIAGAFQHLAGQPANLGLGRIAADIRERLHFLRPPPEEAPAPEESPLLSDAETARLAELRAMDPAVMTPGQAQEMGALANREGGLDAEAQPQPAADPLGR
jgi:hypothetical protein